MYFQVNSFRDGALNKVMTDTFYILFQFIIHYKQIIDYYISLS
jgi:hypothetical protein